MFVLELLGFVHDLNPVTIKQNPEHYPVPSEQLTIKHESDVSENSMKKKYESLWEEFCRFYLNRYFNIHSRNKLEFQSEEPQFHIHDHMYASRPEKHIA